MSFGLKAKSNVILSRSFFTHLHEKYFFFILRLEIKHKLFNLCSAGGLADMSATSTGDEKVKVGLQSVPTLNVQDAEHEANENIMANSSERGSEHMKLKSGIITEGDSKNRQRSGRNRNSSGK